MGEYEKLRQGLISTNIKGDIRQPHNYAFGSVAKGYSRWSTAQTYLSDIDRILREMRMSITLLDKVPQHDYLSDRSIHLEDFVMYHQGYFLALTHQLKDKLAHLLYAVVIAGNTFKSGQSEDIKKIFKHVYNSSKVNTVPKLKDNLTVWQDGSDTKVSDTPSSITRALKKRTKHHHQRNPLVTNENYFQASSSRMLLEPSFMNMLSDYGKEAIAEKGSNNAEAWRLDCVAQMKEVLSDIEVNLDTISSNLMTYYKFPHHDEDRKRIALRWVRLMSDVEVKAVTRELSLTSDFIRRYVGILLKVLSQSGVKIVSVYLVGSASRGDFMMGVSDINIVVIAQDCNFLKRYAVREVIKKKMLFSEIPLDIKIIEKEDFLSEEHKKDRFICNTDGTLIDGEDLLKGKPLLKKSYELVWLLNSDFKDYLQSVKTFLEKEKSISEEELCQIARDLSKRNFRLGFGMIIGNNTVYSNRYLEMHMLTKFYMPENKRVSGMLYHHITSRLVSDREGVEAIIEFSERTALPMFEAIKTAVRE